MNKQDLLKIQTCVLRMNVHCDGCKHKVKKKLQKVKGVSKVNIDVEQGKVSVTGNVDPSTLIEKLEKAGKHAELWGPQKGQLIPMMNFQIEKKDTSGGKDSKALKGVKDQIKKGGFQAPQDKGSKDATSLGKDQNSVRFNLPQDKEDDDDFEDSDEEYEDESDDEDFAAHQPNSKVERVAGGGGQGLQGNSNKHKGSNNGANKGGNGKKGGENGKKSGGIENKGGGNGKKGGVIGMILKGMLGKASGGNRNKAGKTIEKNGKFVAREVKKGSKITMDGGGGGKNDRWSKKKLGDDFDGDKKSDSKQPDFNAIKANYRGGGRNTGLTGPYFQAEAEAMNAGHFQGIGYYQQHHHHHHHHHHSMMNQQSGNRHDDFYQPRLQPPAMAYGGMVTDQQYTHIFSDENTESCSIM